MVKKQKKTYQVSDCTIIRLETGRLLAGSTSFSSTLEEDDKIEYSNEIL